MLLLKKKQVLTPLLISFFSIFFSFTSCSIDYGRMKTEGEKRPNIVFKNINVDRYENTHPSLLVSCERLEMYSKDKIWVGKTLRFRQLERNSDTDEFTGVANLALIDDTKEEYFLGEGVEFKSVKDHLTINAPSLYWMKKEHLLTSTEKDEVTVEKEGEFSMKGRGFISNTSSKEFEFKSQVEGIIETNKEEDHDFSENIGK